MKTTLKLSFCILLAALGAIGWLWLQKPGVLHFGMHQDPNAPPMSRYILGYAMTLLGVLCGSGYRQLQQMPTDVPIDPCKFFRGLALSVNMWIALFGSPMAFALILQTVADISTPGYVVMSLQNGFCCTFVVNAFLMSKHPQKTKGDGP